MNIIEEISKLEAQKELLDKLLEGDEVGYLGKIKLREAYNSICFHLSKLQKEATKTVEDIENSFVAAFDLETQTEEAHRKLEVRKQNDNTFRFILTSTFKDGVVVQNYLHLGKNAFYLFQNAFHKASREFGFTKEDLREYEKSKTNCIEYKFEDNE